MAVLILNQSMFVCYVHMYISKNVPTPLQWPKDDDHDDEICKNKSSERKNYSYKITKLVFAKQKILILKIELLQKIPGGGYSLKWAI